MLIIKIKEGENLDKAVRRFKKKYEKTGVLKELRARQAFTKPSVKKRMAKLKAVYRQKVLENTI